MAIGGLGFGLYMAVDLALVADVLPDTDSAAKDLGVMNIAGALPVSIAPAIAPAILAIGGGSYSVLLRGGRRLRHRRSRRHPARQARPLTCPLPCGVGHGIVCSTTGWEEPRRGGPGVCRDGVLRRAARCSPTCSTEQPGTGASFAVWHDGEWVVDLWGGYADAAHTRPWQRDTLVMPYSVTKPFAAMCVLTLVDRGLVDLDAPMQRYWPELRAAGDGPRRRSSHRAGLVALDEDAPEEAFYDWDLMCSLLARQEPTLGARAPRRASRRCSTAICSARWCARSTAARWGGSSARRSAARTTWTSTSGSGDAELARVADLTGFGEEFRASQEGYPDLYRRAIGNPPGARDPRVVNGERWRRAEIPAVNGHGTARAVAGFYVALAHGRLVGPALVAELTRGRRSRAGPGGRRRRGEWGLGVAPSTTTATGWAAPAAASAGGARRGQYAAAFLTGHVGTHDRGDRLESVVRDVLGLPAL